MHDYPLISAVELSNSLGNPEIFIFDIRGKWGESANSGELLYSESHIPGAFFLDWTRYFIDTGKPLAQAPAPSPAKAQESFAHFGLTGKETVVLYDDYASMFASRLWWVLRYLGYPKVKILDGGWTCWLKQNLATEQGIITPPSITKDSAFSPTLNPAIHATTENVENRSTELKLIDGRGEASFFGNKDDKRSGHIPGAINIPFRSLLDEDNQFKDKQSLLQIFESKGVDPASSEIISSCGSGYSATVLSVALKILGREVPVYDDSFAIWKQAPNRAVEQT